MRRIVVIIIRDHAGQYFVHRRLEDKETNPGRYGLGAGGRVEAGETPLAAATRELAEETGLRVLPLALFELPYANKHVAQILNVFEVRIAPQLIPNDDTEWQWSGWMSRVEVDDLNNSQKLCPDTALVYERYLAL